jgi:hypothetical protein
MGNILCICHQKSPQYKRMTFVKYRLLIWLKKKERNSKRRGKEREHPQNAPFHISYQPKRSRIHKKAESIIEKRMKEREN